LLGAAVRSAASGPGAGEDYTYGRPCVVDLVEGCLTCGGVGWQDTSVFTTGDELAEFTFRQVHRRGEDDAPAQHGPLSCRQFPGLRFIVIR
jgi:hypothetical protein